MLGSRPPANSIVLSFQVLKHYKFLGDIARMNKIFLARRTPMKLTPQTLQNNFAVAWIRVIRLFYEIRIHYSSIQLIRRDVLKNVLLSHVVAVDVTKFIAA